VQYRILQ